MPFWSRKHGRVYIYEYQDGRQRQMKPRREISFLDSQPDDVVTRFVDSLSPPKAGVSQN